MRTPLALAGRMLLYWRTLRHLRPVQWVYLPVRRLQGPASPPAHASGAVDEVRVPRMAEAVRFWNSRSDADALARARDVLAGRFVFLNRAEHLHSVQWRRRYVSHLWSYNLQYFAYAVDLARAYVATGDPTFVRCFEGLAESWIDEVGDGGGDGWEPYALSLRIVHWTYALLLFGTAVRPEVMTRIVHSLHRQTGALEARREIHLQANHLQKNDFALAVGGLFLGGAAAHRWRQRGFRGVWNAVADQVHQDGGHIERSPMYHAMALCDFLEAVDPCRALAEPVPLEAVERIRAMVAALGVLARPDGSLHLFNDAAYGIAPPLAHLDRLARRTLGVGLEWPSGPLSLPESGFCGYSVPPGERLVVDCGEPGPTYQAGHAHCGALSFELDLHGAPFVVDSGVHGYGGDPFREYVRSTRAHNTVMICGKEQSEVWGTFRMARRARVPYARQSAAGETYRFEGACRPYHARGVHHRVIRREAGGDWSVVDRVEGPAGELSSFVHLHPSWTVEADAGRVVARRGADAVVIDVFGADELRLHLGERDPMQGWYCGEFGKALPAPVLELCVHGAGGCSFGYRFSPQ